MNFCTGIPRNLGVWLLLQYLSTGAKPDVQLVELGLGRGMLMDDILRVRNSFSNVSVAHPIGLRQFPHTRASVEHVHLVEFSPSLRAVQEKKLQA